jgi:hypothetical protein
MTRALRIAFDPHKSEENFRKHGHRLEDFRGFDRSPITISDERRDYQEPRWRSFGRIDGLGYMIAFTVREDELRLISFRRAHEKEMSIHDRSS